MTHDLLQHLWLHQTTVVEVSAVTIHADHITITPPRPGSCRVEDTFALQAPAASMVT